MNSKSRKHHRFAPYRQQKSRFHDFNLSDKQSASTSCDSTNTANNCAPKVVVHRTKASRKHFSNSILQRSSNSIVLMTPESTNDTNSQSSIMTDDESNSNAQFDIVSGVVAMTMFSGELILEDEAVEDPVAEKAVSVEAVAEEAVAEDSNLTRVGTTGIIYTFEPSNNGRWNVIGIIPANRGTRYVIWDHKPRCRDFNECTQIGLGTENRVCDITSDELLKICKDHKNEDGQLIYDLQLNYLENNQNAAGKRSFKSCMVSEDLSFKLTEMTPKNHHFQSVLEVLKTFFSEKRFDITGRFNGPQEDLLFISRVFNSWSNKASQFGVFYQRLIGHNCKTKELFYSVLDKLIVEEPSTEGSFPRTSLATLNSDLIELKKKSKTVLFVYINPIGRKNSCSPVHAYLGIIDSLDSTVKMLLYDAFDIIQPTPPKELIRLRKGIRIGSLIAQAFGNQSSGSSCLIRALLLGGCILDGLDYKQHLDFQIRSRKS